MKKGARQSFVTIVTNRVTNAPNAQTKNKISRRRLFKLHGMKAMKMRMAETIANKKLRTCVSWLLMVR